MRVRKSKGGWLKIPGRFFQARESEAEQELIDCLNDEEGKRYPEIVHNHITNLVVDLRKLAMEGPRKRSRLENREEIPKLINGYLKCMSLYPQIEGATVRTSWLPWSVDNQGRDATVPTPDEFALCLIALNFAERGRMGDLEVCLCRCGTWFMRRKADHRYATEACRERDRKSDSHRAARRAAAARKDYLELLEATDPEAAKKLIQKRLAREAEQANQKEGRHAKTRR